MLNPQPFWAEIDYTFWLIILHNYVKKKKEDSEGEKEARKSGWERGKVEKN